MSCTLSEFPSGFRLRAMSSIPQGGTGGGTGSSSGGGVHMTSMLSNTNALGTTTTMSAAGNTSGNVLPEAPAQQQQQSQKPCCLCWVYCCSCSCLALKRAENNAPTKREPSSTDLLLETEQPATLEEIKGWGTSFDKLMNSAAGRKVFADFLHSEYSEENILFWLACEELKKECRPDVIEEKARLIYEDYISILSPKEVSLDSRVREIVNQNMVEPTPNTFDEAQIQIYTLMHRDSYPRFLNSQRFKTLAQLQEPGMSERDSATESAA